MTWPSRSSHSESASINASSSGPQVSTRQAETALPPRNTGRISSQGFGTNQLCSSASTTGAAFRSSKFSFRFAFSSIIQPAQLRPVRPFLPAVPRLAGPRMPGREQDRVLRVPRDEQPVVGLPAKVGALATGIVDLQEPLRDLADAHDAIVDPVAALDRFGQEESVR